MTPEQAIERIQAALDVAEAISSFDRFVWPLREPDKEALRMAIEALKKED